MSFSVCLLSTYSPPIYIVSDLFTPRSAPKSISAIFTLEIFIPPSYNNPYKKKAASGRNIGNVQLKTNQVLYLVSAICIPTRRTVFENLHARTHAIYSGGWCSCARNCFIWSGEDLISLFVSVWWSGAGRFITAPGNIDDFTSKVSRRENWDLHYL